jgi:transcriptional regulator with XRE-family HTH domain
MTIYYFRSLWNDITKVKYKKFKNNKKFKRFKNIIETMLHLSENIKLIRLLSGKTQPEFGKMFDSTKAMIISYEQDRARPNSLFKKRISEYAGISIADLDNKKLRESDIHIAGKEEKVQYGTLRERNKDKTIHYTGGTELLADMRKDIIWLESTVKVLIHTLSEICSQNNLTDKSITGFIEKIRKDTKEVFEMRFDELSKKD